MNEEHDFRPIGALAPRASDLRVVSDSTPTRSSANSSTTGSHAPARTRGNATGTALSETAAVGFSSTLASIQASRETWQTERAVEAFLKRLPPSSISISVGAEGDFLGVELLGELTAEAVGEIAQLAAAAVVPSGARHVATEAGRCLLATKSRERADGETQALVAIFVDELRIYPADVVTTAFRGWARKSPWWPSLAEIVELCEREMPWRRSLLSIGDRRAPPSTIERPRSNHGEVTEYECRREIGAAAGAHFRKPSSDPAA